MATEQRLIDANNLSVMIEETAQGLADCDQQNAAWALRKYAIRDITEATTVDAVEVVHGRWDQVQRWATKAKYRCSACGREIMSAVKVNVEKYPYCHCGAKMDGDPHA